MLVQNGSVGIFAQLKYDFINMLVNDAGYKFLKYNNKVLQHFKTTPVAPFTNMV